MQRRCDDIQGQNTPSSCYDGEEVSGQRSRGVINRAKKHAVRKLFTKVICLDGQQLPKAIGFEVEEDVSKMPDIQRAYIQDANVKDLVLQFIQQYYRIFDTDNRRPLEAAYSENATFSFSCNFPETGPGARYTNIYLTDNRNLKKLTPSDRRHKLVYQGRSIILNYLCRLPYTVHDPLSFCVDVPVADPKLIVVILSGVFRQLADRNPPIRSFTRNIIIIPEGSGFCICNEQLYITTATIDQVKKAFKTPVVSTAQSSEPDTSIPSTSTVPEQSQPPSVPQSAPDPGQQQAMVVKFSTESGMLPQFSQLCLEQNGWDFNKAAVMFSQLKMENKIPPEYFAQSVS
ncbi:Nuclear RNA export factor 1-like 3 [Homarus americanus]|uniref:Nuclear RNA export factor 1-like 3 n=1 Tax=Homarus americanus TaxID=6706 RepID=A0A8J5MWC3_HOMAM|nr:Nuclear RNA export factor 1-like 3 [Homarus americanus]